MSDDTFKLVVDGQEIEVPRHYTLLQACEEAGAEIPRFCYHERLSVAGNCRMCLVEWEGAPKPIASCAQTVGDMRPNRDGSSPRVNTRGDYVQKARNGVMEFLLINHPLDCPICDQGGECDLQDQAMAYGRGGSRFELNKRAVEDKEMGPLVKTIMTRCIQCTRCVRFAAEVAGVEELGMISRGEDAEITTYLEKTLDSELSGNVIDLCPVGALTSKPYAFNARPWELRKTESIDVMDAMGAAIRVDAKGTAVMRILPRIHEEINEEWLSDKSRFVWDGLQRKRLDKPYVRRDGKLTPVTWNEALEVVAKQLSDTRGKLAAVAGDLACVEGMKASKDLLGTLGGGDMDCRPVGSRLGVDGEGNRLPRESYLLNPTLMGIEEADALLLIGANPRMEASVWNARIRKSWLWNELKVGVVGEGVDLTYEYDHLGVSPDALDGLLENTEFGEILKSARRPMIVLGEGALTRADGSAIYRKALELAKSCGALVSEGPENDAWCGFGVLHTGAGRVGGLDLGFVPETAEARDLAGIQAACKSGDIQTVISLGADDVAPEGFDGAFVVYVGSHGDRGAQGADVILPAAAYTEKTSTYVNTEGRIQMTRAAVQPKGEARAEWAIMRALSGFLGTPLPYDTADALREKLAEEQPLFAGLNFAPGHGGVASFDGDLPAGGDLDKAPFQPWFEVYYLTNPIARASKTMAECALQKRNLAAEPIAAE